MIDICKEKEENKISLGYLGEDDPCRFRGRGYHLAVAHSLQSSRPRPVHISLRGTDSLRRVGVNFRVLVRGEYKMQAQHLSSEGIEHPFVVSIGGSWAGGRSLMGSANNPVFFSRLPVREH
jgi:hypothetical protein